MDIFIFGVESYLTLVVMFVLLAVTIFAFVNSLLYSAESYVAAGKLTKPAWNIILGLAVLLQLVPVGLFIIQIAMIIASSTGAMIAASWRPVPAGV
jgi:hypothetical protein